MVFREEYYENIRKTPHIKYRTPVYLWGILAISIVWVLAAVVPPAVMGARY